VISLKLVLHVNHWNWIVHVSVWGSFLVYLGISSAVNLIYVIYPLFAAQYFAFCTYNRPECTLCLSRSRLWSRARARAHWRRARTVCWCTVQLALLPATYAWIGIGVVVCLLPDLLAVLYALRHLNRLHDDTARTHARTKLTAMSTRKV
jgi:hypothetical protein